MANPLRKLLGSGSTSADIGAALERAQADLAAAEAAVIAAEAAYDDGLLDLDKSALRKLLDAATEAKIEVDQIKAKVAKLEGQLEKATAAGAEDGRRAAYEKAKAASDTARKRLVRDYPKAAESLRDILRELAAAAIAVDTANENLPEGAARLEGVEADRSTNNQWREVVDEEVVELWAGIGSQSSPIPDELQRQVTPDARLRRGVASNGEEALCGHVRVESGDTLEVVRRKFIRRRVLPDVGGFIAPPLHSEIVLPALFAGGDAYFTPNNYTPVRLIEELAKPMRPRPEQQKRETVFEYVLAPKEASNEAA
jgi:hypothetical protein